MKTVVINADTGEVVRVCASHEEARKHDLAGCELLKRAEWDAETHDWDPAARKAVASAGKAARKAEGAEITKHIPAAWAAEIRKIVRAEIAALSRGDRTKEGETP